MESTYIRSTDATKTKPSHWIWYVHLPLLAASIASLWLVDRAARYRMLDGTFQNTAFLSCLFVFTAAGIAVFLDLRPDRTSRAAKASFYSLLFAPLVLMSVAVLNGMLDASEPRTYATTVAAKRSACGFPRPRCIYTVELVSWRGWTGTEHLHVSEQIFGKLKVGQSVAVVTRNGWLGLPWIQSVSFSDLGQGSISKGQPGKVEFVMPHLAEAKPPSPNN
jgi:hypothetical protein